MASSAAGTVASRLRRWLNSSPGLFLAITAAVFVTRLPFLTAGYGLDPDAWRVANAARMIALSDSYVASRLPGYPVPEIICALLWRGGPLALNGATALLSAVGVACFVLALRVLRIDHALVAGLTLAMVPVVYINSTSSMDYMWSLAFTLMALYFVLTHRIGWAGLAMGLAIGSRITAGAMLVPLGMLLLRSSATSRRYRDVAVFSAVAGSAGLVAFAPVILTYGSGFFTFYEQQYPPLSQVLRLLALGPWGSFGLAALLLAGAVHMFDWRRNLDYVRGLRGRPHIEASIVAIVLTLIAFSRLPHESGYLLPAVPSFSSCSRTISGSARSSWSVSPSCARRSSGYGHWVSQTVRSWSTMQCGSLSWSVRGKSSPPRKGCRGRTSWSRARGCRRSRHCSGHRRMARSSSSTCSTRRRWSGTGAKTTLSTICAGSENSTSTCTGSISGIMANCSPSRCYCGRSARISTLIVAGGTPCA